MASSDELQGLSRSEVLRASPRMFESNLLDKLSRVHPAVPPILFGPVIAFMLVYGLIEGSGWMTPVWLVGGYLFWTLTEYWLHRVVFHFEPEDGIGARLHFIIHGVHHDHPNDPMRLVMPPSVSVPLAALFVFGFYEVLGSPAYLPFGAAFLAGYLFYDMLHYHVHHHRPKTALGKRLRELHMRHHFQNHERGYGVSAPFWDHVFGTAPNAARAVRPLTRRRASGRYSSLSLSSLVASSRPPLRASRRCSSRRRSMLSSVRLSASGVSSRPASSTRLDSPGSSATSVA